MNDKTSYIDDFLVISKLDNPEVIHEYIKMVKEQTIVTLTI